MKDLLSELNEPQRLAVTTTEGPLLIIAGAGSGKTKALTYRIAYLIQENIISPDHILAVTFTNKAANEMKERISRLLGGPKRYQEPLVGTFHSVCVKILRHEIHHLGHENRFVIYDTADSEALMKRIIKEQRLDEKQFNPRTVLSHISRAKNNLVDESAYTSKVNSMFEEQVAHLYPLYQKHLQKSQALDFDDLIFKTIQLFWKYPKILDRYQEKFQYISIDEYQDTNYAQYIFSKLLAQKYRNICVIGDDWQSIYSWRGADMTNILNFQKDYPEAVIIKLEQNYRSTKVIVEAANHLIKQNIRRTEKTLWTKKESEEKIEVYETDTERDEADRMIELMEDALRQDRNRTYRDFAVLYRTNAQSRMMEESFLRHGIPYKIIGGVGFYERKEIKDVLAYLKVIHNPQDSVSLLRIINVPPRKIGATTIEKLTTYSNTYDVTFFEALHRSTEMLDLSSSTKTHLKSFYDLLVDSRKKSNEYPVGSLLKYLLPTSEYKDYLQDGTEEGEERWQNVQELISVATKYDKLEPAVSLSTFLEEVSLVSQVDSLHEKKDEGVILMTLHNAKGLEFPFVFIVGLEEGIFPHAQSQWTQDELEEERRLMYVGVTRAKEKLYLLYTRARLLYGDYRNNIPSRFLFEIPAEYVVHNTEAASQQQYTHTVEKIRVIGTQRIHDFHDGDRILHKSWGEGVIVSVQGDVATVAFKDPTIGIKKMAINIAPLEKI